MVIKGIIWVCISFSNNCNFSRDYSICNFKCSYKYLIVVYRVLVEVFYKVNNWVSKLVSRCIINNKY